MTQQISVRALYTQVWRLDTLSIALFTDYFAYISLVTVATLTVILSLGFSATTAIAILKEVSKPTMFENVAARPAEPFPKSWSYSISK